MQNTTSYPDLSFDDVCDAEYEALRKLSGEAGLASGEVSRDQLLGLAFSGGGIRSATFNLGVLQALAELKLLKELDYLSTVSGGGYIGSWLSAWIHRTDAQNLAREQEEEQRTGQLQAHTPGVVTVQERLSPKHNQGREPKAVSFLRSYSNYLTPKTGLFSTDTLAGVATYLRNFLLNLSILIPCLTFVLLTPRLVAWLGLYADRFPYTFFVVGVLALALAVFFINLNLASQLPRSQSSRDKRRQGSQWTAPRYAQRPAVLGWIVLPLTVAALALGLWLARGGHDLAQAFLDLDWNIVLLDAAIVAGVTGTIAGFWWLALKAARVKREPGDRPTWRWRLAALAVGVTIGLLAFVAFQATAFGSATDATYRLWWATVWGVPGLIGVFALTTVFVVGMSGRQFEEDSREWWSRVGGVLLGVAAGWLVVAGTAVYAPLWVMKVTRLVETLGIAWIVTTVAGVRAAMSAATGKPGSTTWREPLAKITPYVFVAGLLIALAYGIHVALAMWIDEKDVRPAAFLAAGNAYFEHISSWLSAASLAPPFLLVLIVAGLFSWRIDVNLFAFHMFYRNRLVRCYLGASNPRRGAHPFTGFDGDDSLLLKTLVQRPYHLINTAINLTRGNRLAWQERKAASFVASPLFCGYELKENNGSGTQAYQLTAEFLKGENERRRQRAAKASKRPGQGAPAGDDGADLGMGLGTALAVSGAAASPNQGYHSTPAVAFLMTIFNVRLGWWLQNPAYRDVWRREGPRWGIRYLLSELAGMADEHSKYVHVSDGGHFDNLGIYELVRRRCRFIVACDAGMDPKFEFEDLGNAIRKCQVDLGVDIKIDTRAIRPDPVNRRSQVHCAVGTIKYPATGAEAFSDESASQRGPNQGAQTPLEGYLLYIKPSLTGNERLDILQYAAAHPEFPNETTADQWFAESQFESYRKLGYHILKAVFTAAGIEEPRPREYMFVALQQRWYPRSAATTAAFTRQGDQLKLLADAQRTDTRLRFLDGQLYPEWNRLSDTAKWGHHHENLWLPASHEELRAGFHFCRNMLELMENVYVDLNLEEDYAHPDNRGWINLFKHWSWCSMFLVTYSICCSMHGARFQSFCERRLGLRPGRLSVSTALPSGRPVDSFLERAKQEKLLNSFERQLIVRLHGAGLEFDRVHFLQMRVSNPAAAEQADAPSGRAFLYTFGFALTQEDTLVYFRVQDHARRMSHARGALSRLYYGCKVQKLRLEPSKIRNLDFLEKQDIAGFRQLFESVAQQGNDLEELKDPSTAEAATIECVETS